jgi:hypothetical protein
MIVRVRAIGFVEAIRQHLEDDFWGGEESRTRYFPNSDPSRFDVDPDP